MGKRQKANKYKQTIKQKKQANKNQTNNKTKIPITTQF